MTERPEQVDQAERIRRLQERRAASGRAPAAASTSNSKSAPAPKAKTATGKRRRRHPAAASRIVLAGLSVASFFTIGGSLMLAQNHAATVGTSSVVTNPANSTSSAVPTAKSATSSTHATPTAHTTTRAS